MVLLPGTVFQWTSYCMRGQMWTHDCTMLVRNISDYLMSVGAICTSTWNTYDAHHRVFYTFETFVVIIELLAKSTFTVSHIKVFLSFILFTCARFPLGPNCSLKRTILCWGGTVGPCSGYSTNEIGYMSGWE